MGAYPAHSSLARADQQPYTAVDMPSHPAIHSLRRWSRVPSVLLLLVLATLIGLYLFSPTLLPLLLSRIAGDQGMTLQHFDMQRPRLTRWNISAVELTTEEQSWHLRDLRLDYSWQGLLAGRLATIELGELRVRFNADGVEDPAATASLNRDWHSRLPQQISLTRWLQDLPWTSLRIRSLIVQPTATISLAGELRQEGAELLAESRIVGVAPLLQHELKLAYGDATGLSLSLREGDNPPAITVNSRFAENAVDLNTRVNLADADAALVQSLLKLPQLPISLQLSMNSRVPWPIPTDYGPRDLAITGALALSADLNAEVLGQTADIQSIGLEELAGTFDLSAGVLSLFVDQGEVQFAQASGPSQGRCVISEPVMLRATAHELELSDGINCRLEGDLGSVDLSLSNLGYARSSSDSQGLPVQLQLQASYAAQLERLQPQGEVRLQLQQADAFEITGTGSVAVTSALALPLPSGSGPLLLPFTLRYQPADEHLELTLAHRLQLGNRILAALSKEWDQALDISRGRLEYQGQLQWQRGAWSAQLAGTVTELHFDYPPTLPSGELRLRDVSGDFRASLQASQLELQGQVQRGTLAFPYLVRYDLLRRRGQARSNFSQSLSENALAGMFVNWSEPFDLAAGDLHGVATATIEPEAPIAVAAQATLTRGALTFADYVAEGVDAKLHLEWSGERLQLRADDLRVSQIDIGFPLTAIAVNAHYQEQGQARHLQLRDLGARLLGGEAHSEGLSIDLNDPSGTFDVQLTNLSLAQLLALEGEDVGGTGTLSGSLPVRISSAGVEVHNGLLESLPPGGVIRLSEQFANPTGQPGLDFAVGALSDFRYDALTASVDYTPTGDLKLGVALRGHNPKVERGRQINYNVNVSENVLTLLQSLQADQLVTEQVERRVNR
ncbi:MAG: intermembrane phospholipid transport protein YdbH family protein [Pseudomonadales bacterium]